MKVLNTPLFEEEDAEYPSGGGGYGSGVDVFDDVDPIAEDPADPGEEVGLETEDPAPVQQTPASSQQNMVSLDAVQQIVAAMQQKQATPQRPQLTPEQINQKLNHFSANPDLVGKLFGDNATDESRQQALQSIVDGTARHLTTVMGYAQQLQMAEVQKQYAEVARYVEAQQEQEFSSNLLESVPALKGREQAVGLVIRHLKAQGYYEPDVNKVYQTIASGVEALLKQADPGFSLAKQRQAQQTPRRMPAMSGGVNGGGGGGAVPVGASTAPNFNDIFE